MAIILQLSLCLYELQRLVISVDDCLLSQNVMFPLTTGLYNVVHFLVIGGVFPDSIGEYLTMVCQQMLVLSENCACSIFGCISINLKQLLYIG